MTASQDSQAYLRRWVTITRNCAGIMSSRSDVSSLIMWRGAPLEQVVLSGSITPQRAAGALVGGHGWIHGTQALTWAGQSLHLRHG